MLLLLLFNWLEEMFFWKWTNTNPKNHSFLFFKLHDQFPPNYYTTARDDALLTYCGIPAALLSSAVTVQCTFTGSWIKCAFRVNLKGPHTLNTPRMIKMNTCTPKNHGRWTKDTRFQILYSPNPYLNPK